MNEPVKLAVVQAPPADSGAQAEERMYREIYDAIMEHRLPARTKLAEQSLGEIYKLARHGVRKVLNQLAADGLVDLEPNRGAFIASPSDKEAQDMFDLRYTLEQMVIEKAMAGAVDTKALRALVERERAAYMQGDRSLWIRLSADFHIELAKLSGNDLLVEMLRRLVSRTTLLISTTDAPGNQPCSFDEHLKVLQAMEQKDKAGALQEMAHHLQQCSCRTPQKSDKGFDLRAALGKPRPSK
ncbi:GntR family transcriptional regulator [Undibacterium terreum]|uniref:GntR family transcriptional regulator n=1 Tax=Undibacterium terreum TaxID=1224302 RepID=A0A916XQ17_9BURK|nr:GntR family transcriptional regulator [Undibacterium terreum]GGC93933.1 GntR family transcriptional regulator [Undibacterium terreum]